MAQAHQPQHCEVCGRNTAAPNGEEHSHVFDYVENELYAEVHEIYSCPITSDIMFEPRITPCGHEASKEPLERWVSEHHTCPKCRRAVEYLNRSISTQSLLNSLLVYCPFCRSTTKREMLQRHFTSCSRMPIPCPNNCGSFPERQDHATHFSVTCTHVQVKCTHPNCPHTCERRYLSAHLQACGYALMVCPQKCGSEILKMDLDRHMETSCNKRNVYCGNRFGAEKCDFILPYSMFTVSSHRDSCPLRLIKCPRQCGMDVCAKDAQHECITLLKERFAQCLQEAEQSKLAIEHFKSMGHLSSSHLPNTRNDIESKDAIGVLHIMKRSLNAVDVQCEGCKTLCRLAEEDKSHRLAATYADGINWILSAMKHHRNVANMQREACKALLAISIDCHDSPDIVKELSKGATHAIIHCSMSAFPSDEEIQATGCLALGNMAVSLEICRRIDAEGGIIAIIRSMIQFSDKLRVQENGVQALANLAAYINIGKIYGVDSAMTTSVAATIIRAMKSVSNENTKERAFFALAMMNRNIANRKDFVTSDGLSEIIATMRAFPGNGCIQQFGCVILSDFLIMSDYTTQVVQEGGIAALINAPAVITEDAQRMLCYCYIFSTLMILSGTTMNKAVDIELRKEDVLEKISEGMIHFQTSRLINGLGCAALIYFLRTWNHHRESMNFQVQVKAILTVLQLHKDDQAIRENVCAVLACMPAKSLQAYAQSDQCLVEEIMDTICKHLENLLVLFVGCDALNKLSQNEDIIDLIFPEASVTRVIQILIEVIEKLFTLSSPMKEQAEIILRILGFWRNIVAFDRGRKSETFITAGGLRYLIRSMLAYTSIETVQNPACSIFAHLAATTEGNRQRIWSEGGFDAVIQAMGHCNNSVSVCRDGLVFLVHMIANNSCQEHKISMGAVDIILSSINNHCTKEEDVHRWGCIALNILTRSSNECRQRILHSGVIHAIKNAGRLFPNNRDVLQDLK